MDAALWELLEEGDSEDEIAAIIRLGQAGVAPPGVRLVTQFGHIATCRLERGAILTTREDESVASFKAARVLAPEPEIEDSSFEDLPKSVSYVDQRRPPDETATGRGVVVGVVDWGCDFAHPDFRNPDGSTRLLALWDQRSRNSLNSPSPYGYGVVHTPAAINQALATADPYAALNYHPADADTGKGSHGTHVLSIAAGNGRGGGPQGVAPEAQLVFVHSAPLSHEKSERLGDSVTLLEAVDFISRMAGDRPWVINLSMGRHGEQHDGSTLVEQGLDEALRSAPGCAIVQSTGNYFERGIHSSGQLRPTETRCLIWEVEEVDPTPNQLEIWYSGLDSIEIELSDPAESIRPTAALGEQVVVSLAGQEIGKIYHRRSEPNNLCNHIEIFLYAGAPGGRWGVTLKGKDIVDGRFHAWIERDAACPRCQSKFSTRNAISANTTGTICNGFRTIAVGAYNPHSPRHEIAPFSSSGPTRDGRLKPDLLAPGVRILAARSTPRESVDRREMLTRMSGTSMASPYVAGTVALMFEVAPRRLRIEETHNLLLSSTRKPNLLGENITRIGSGYCEISNAVAAARSISTMPGSPGPHKILEAEAHMESDRPKLRETTEDNSEQASPPHDRRLSPEALETEPEQASEQDEQFAVSYQDASYPDTAITESGQLGSNQTQIGGLSSQHMNANIEAQLVEHANDVIGAARGRGLSHRAMLGETIERVTGANPLKTNSRLAGSLSPTSLFGAYAYQNNPAVREHFDQFFEVVALPRSPFPEIRSGDILVRDAAEGGLAHVALLASGDAFRAEELASAGIRAESSRPGYYSEVIEAGSFPHCQGDRFARRLSDENGLLTHDGLILRIRPEALRSPSSLSNKIADRRFVSPESAPLIAETAAGPTGPPNVVSGWPLGVDLYQRNNTNAAGFRNLKTRGKTFAIAKSSQGVFADGRFPDYYRWIRESGMIRGSYHFFANKWGGVPQPWLHGTNADQANLVISLVQRLGPGDLAPAIDLEDEPRMPDGSPVPDQSPPGTGRYPLDQGLTNAQRGWHYRRNVYPNWNVGRDALLVDIQDFLDRLEIALGRTPLIYTSHMWMDTDMMNNPHVMSEYPLWTVYHGGDLRAISAGGWGRKWAFIQYAEQGKRNWGLNPYNEPGIQIGGLDFDAYNGTIHGLRGLADLGHTAPHLVGNLECIAYTEPDGRLHLLEYLTGSWRDEDISNARLAHLMEILPPAAGDPAAVALGNEQVIVFRATNDHIYALTRILTDAQPNWHAEDITGGGGTAVGDPFVLLFGDSVHVIYWDQFNAHIHLKRVNGGWQAESFVDMVAPYALSQVCGSAIAYEHQDARHVVSRSRRAGHLFDFSAPVGSAPAQDLTAASHSAGGVTPAATYRPAIYKPARSAARIVFRAVRGDVWQIERDTLNATNLRMAAVDASNAGGMAPTAAGSPTATFSNIPHIFYRTAAGTIIDLFGDANMMRWQIVCDDAAADPTAFIDTRGHAAVSFRANDGTIRIARFVNGVWNCERATRPLGAGRLESVPERQETADSVFDEWLATNAAEVDAAGAITAELAPLKQAAPETERVSATSTLAEQVSVDDVVDEMNGLRCCFLSAHRATHADGSARGFAAGALLPIDNWNGTDPEATVAGFRVPKLVLAPDPESVSGLRRYDVALDSQRAAVLRNTRELAEWVAREGEYHRNRVTWERERARLETLLSRRQATYNRMWVREMMYNRFDVPIASWVRHYNTQLNPATGLDANIVKSMLYQESRMGTSGAHLMPPPSDWSSSERHPIRSRYNLGQAIDSWGPQQWLMMSEMAPAISTRYGLNAFDRTWLSMSNDDYAAHAPFIRALREFFEFRDGSNRNLMGSPARDLHEDYGFWIRTAIRWLFVKYAHLASPTWAEAVRSYNGGGPRARAYRDAVMSRVGRAEPFSAESADWAPGEIADGEGVAIAPVHWQEDAPHLDSSATLTWEDLSRATNSRGQLQLFYIVTGAPPSVARIGDEGKAIFHLRVHNTNSVYNHKDVATKYRVLDVLPNRQFREVMPWRRFSGPDLEDETSRVIKLSIGSQTLLGAYNPDAPLTRLEVEYHWRETWEDTQEHYNRTGLDFLLVAPIEYLLSRKQRLTTRDIELNDPARHKADYWIPITGVDFTSDIRQPVTIQLDVLSSVSSSATGQQTTSSGQTRSSTRSSTTSNTFSVQLNGEVSQGGSASANIEVLELGVQEMFKLGASLGYAHTRTDTSSTTVAREFTRSLMLSRTYATSQAVTTRTTLTVSPPEVPQPRGTGGSSEPRVRSVGTGSVGVYLYPLVAFFEVPYVRFEGVNAMGQATRRSEGRVAVPFVTEWRLTSHRGG